ncbi:uncharacterized protein LOC131658277 [Vicia villosa]|uniref:uncharacterized protein LOC131658277 n=1 Tax=Vicia villosa TaxID=3911 RepID=UPI00273B4060|nr:uncharacterized protein LOC131658277 [Vicia villosa]
MLEDATVVGSLVMHRLIVRIRIWCVSTVVKKAISEASVRSPRRNNLVGRLGLVLSAMNGEMVVDTPAKGSVTTSLVCLKCPVSVFDRYFLVDFVCLLLRGWDVILGMNWFSSPEEEGLELLLARQFHLLMKEDVQVFALVASMSVENQTVIESLKMLCSCARKKGNKELRNAEIRELV